METKNKIDNPTFVDKETIPLAQDEDFDYYNISNVDETSFTELIPPKQHRPYN